MSSSRPAPALTPIEGSTLAGGLSTALFLSRSLPMVLLNRQDLPAHESVHDDGDIVSCCKISRSNAGLQSDVEEFGLLSFLLSLSFSIEMTLPRDFPSRRERAQDRKRPARDRDDHSVVIRGRGDAENHLAEGDVDAASCKPLRIVDIVERPGTCDDCRIYRLTIRVLHAVEPSQPDTDFEHRRRRARIRKLSDDRDHVDDGALLCEVRAGEPHDAGERSVNRGILV